ncbi:hypothetical protein [Pseudomonas sp. Irchel 3H3]|nr:hypothetical protein [Pseudomonas sp. Irchel 3H3]
MNPYLITGPAQIGISSGRASGHMVYKILEAHGGSLQKSGATSTGRTRCG